MFWLMLYLVFVTFNVAMVVFLTWLENAITRQWSEWTDTFRDATLRGLLLIGFLSLLGPVGSLFFVIATFMLISESGVLDYKPFKRDF